MAVPSTHPLQGHVTFHPTPAMAPTWSSLPLPCSNHSDHPPVPEHVRPLPAGPCTSYPHCLAPSSRGPPGLFLHVLLAFPQFHALRKTFPGHPISLYKRPPLLISLCPVLFLSPALTTVQHNIWCTYLHCLPSFSPTTMPTP